MTRPVPKRLNKEPIVDAIFEVRFKTKAPASNILPGILFGQLPGEKKIEKLPAAELPEQIRKTDPNLQFAPIVRIRWNDFHILIGDNSVAVGCALPYPRWTAFKQTITTVLETLKTPDIVDTVQRYSLKYVDLIERESLAEQLAAINVKLQIGNNKITKEGVQLKVELKEKDLIHVFQIITSAQVKLESGQIKTGVVVDIDTIRQLKNLRMDAFLQIFNSTIDKMQKENSNHFFGCLTDETLESLEPEYE